MFIFFACPKKTNQKKGQKKRCSQRTRPACCPPFFQACTMLYYNKFLFCVLAKTSAMSGSGLWASPTEAERRREGLIRMFLTFWFFCVKTKERINIKISFRLRQSGVCLTKPVEVPEYFCFLCSFSLRVQRKSRIKSGQASYVKQRTYD